MVSVVVEEDVVVIVVSTIVDTVGVKVGHPLVDQAVGFDVTISSTSIIVGVLIVGFTVATGERVGIPVIMFLSSILVGATVGSIGEMVGSINGSIVSDSVVPIVGFTVAGERVGMLVIIFLSSILVGATVGSMAEMVGSINRSIVAGEREGMLLILVLGSIGELVDSVGVSDGSELGK